MPIKKADPPTRISNSNGQKSFHYFPNDLNGVIACLKTYGIADKQLAAGKGSGLANFGIVVLNVSHGHVAHKLVEDMIWKSQALSFLKKKNVLAARETYS